jgi:hypothetical protein
MGVPDFQSFFKPFLSLHLKAFASVYQLQVELSIIRNRKWALTINCSALTFANALGFDVRR